MPEVTFEIINEKDKFPNVSNICKKNWSSKIKKNEKSIKNDVPKCSTSINAGKRTVDDGMRFPSFSKVWYGKQAPPKVPGQCAAMVQHSNTLVDVRDTMSKIQCACKSQRETPSFDQKQKIDTLYQKYRMLKIDLMNINFETLF